MLNDGRTSERRHLRADAGSTPTPVTYYPVPLQMRLLENAKAIEGKPYADAFTRDLTVSPDWSKSLQDGPMPFDRTMTPSIADLARFASDPEGYPDSGYALLDGPTAYIQSRVVMPGVTTEMFRWWFTWHPIENERYSLWYPHAHVSNRVEYPGRLADKSLSFEERLFGNVNYVEEFIGATSLPIHIHFSHPRDLGMDEDALDRAGLTTSVSGTLRFGMAPEVTSALMLHLARDTEAGMELFSRYWIGAHPELHRFPGAEGAAALLAKMNLDADGALQLAYDMSVHDMTEYSHLARILPRLFSAFGKRD